MSRVPLLTAVIEADNDILTNRTLYIFIHHPFLNMRVCRIIQINELSSSECMAALKPGIVRFFNSHQCMR